MLQAYSFYPTVLVKQELAASQDHRARFEGDERRYLAQLTIRLLHGIFAHIQDFPRVTAW